MGFLHDSTKTPAAQGAPQKGGRAKKGHRIFPHLCYNGAHLLS